MPLGGKAISENQGVNALLELAHEKEKGCLWMDAADFYRRALDLVPTEDFHEMGRISENTGYAFYKAAMQAETVDEFRNRIREATGSYEKAKQFFGRLVGPRRTARILRCDAAVAYLGSWLSLQVSQKKKLLEEAWSLAKEALQTFKDTDERFEFGVTYNRLSTGMGLQSALEWDPEVLKNTLRETAEFGEQTIKLLSDLGANNELATAYARTAGYWAQFGARFLDTDDKEQYDQRGRAYWQKAFELSREIALLELYSASYFILLDWAYDEYGANGRVALDYAMKTRDRSIIGSLLAWFAHAFSLSGLTGIRPVSTEEPGQAAELIEGALRYAREAEQLYSSISLVPPLKGIGGVTQRFWVAAPNAEYFLDLALVETNIGRRRDLLQKAWDAAPGLIDRAYSSGYPDVISYAHNVFSRILSSLVQRETDPEQKKALLEEALKHATESIKINQLLSPYAYWDRALMQNLVAESKSQLAELSKEPDRKRKILEDAVREKEVSLKLSSNHALYWERMLPPEQPVNVVVGQWQYEYGDLLTRLYEHGGNREYLRRAVASLEQAAEFLQRTNMPSRVAECYWKAGQVYDTLGDHSNASERFVLASTYYKVAAEKIPLMNDFYSDLVSYMEAWSCIEKAKHHHGREDYQAAKRHYERAAELHKSTKQWKLLSSNYWAWARIEDAEDMSRAEQGEEAVRAFRQAVMLFQESKASMEKEVDSIDDADESQMVRRLILASDLRQQYCAARILIEEAKLLDKKGDQQSSSETYRLASKALERISNAVHSEEEQREIGLMRTLSMAWEMMAKAESEASPELYLEASQLFEKAREFAQSKKSRLLILGHSRLSRALELGMRFIETRNPELHLTAVLQLQSAAEYYLKAGFHNASEYAKATKLLLDAYMHMSDATNERDQEKKAQLYTLAEKVLETSASSYGSSQQSERRAEVLRLLESVREERELSISLAMLLRTPPVVSTTAALTTPRPTFEEAVGLQRFGDADIRASLAISREVLVVGEKVLLEIELVNIGKGLAQLVKVEGLVPASFEVLEKPGKYEVRDAALDVRGMQLGPLKTKQIKLIVRPRVQGRTSLSPNILYLDESGRYKSSRPEAAEIVVKEPPIPDWLRGPGPIQIPPEIRFETDRARDIFCHLVSAFRDDFVLKGLFLERAGWRSLMQLVRESGLPRSAFYGIGGRRGRVLDELERGGLVERRIFTEERGRGGEITKIRLAYDRVISQVSLVTRFLEGPGPRSQTPESQDLPG